MNSNKKLLSVLLAAVLLVGCIVGMLIVGANASGATEWVLGETEVNGEVLPLDLEEAMHIAAEQTWAADDELIITIPKSATPYQLQEFDTFVSSNKSGNTTYTYGTSSLFLDQPTIWADNANRVMLPITIQGSGTTAAETVVKVAMASSVDANASYNAGRYSIFFTNKITFKSMTLDLGNAAINLFAGSGQTVFEDSFSLGSSLTNVYVYGDNNTQAVYTGWKNIPTSSNPHKSSITIGAGISQPGRCAATHFYGNQFPDAPGYTVASKASASVVDAELVHNGPNWTTKADAYYLHFTDVNGARTQARTAIIEIRKGSVKEVRGISGTRSIIRFGAEVKVTGGSITSRLWLGDQSHKYEQGVTFTMTAGAAPFNQFVKSRSGQLAVFGGPININVTGGTIDHGEVTYHSAIQAASTIPSVNVSLKDCRIRGAFNLFTTGATITNDLNVTLDNVKADADIMLAKGASSSRIKVGGDVNVTVKNCDLDGQLYAANYADVTGGIAFDASNSEIHAVQLGVVSAVSGTINATFDSVVLTNTASAIQGFRMLDTASAGSVGSTETHKIEFKGDSKAAGIMVPYGAGGASARSTVYGNVELIIGGNTEVGIEGGTTDSIYNNGFVEGDLAVTLKDNAKVLGNYGVIRHANVTGNVTFTIQDNVVIDGDCRLSRVTTHASSIGSTTVEGIVTNNFFGGTINGNVFAAGTADYGASSEIKNFFSGTTVVGELTLGSEVSDAIIPRISNYLIGGKVGAATYLGGGNISDLYSVIGVDADKLIGTPFEDVEAPNDQSEGFNCGRNLYAGGSKDCTINYTETYIYNGSIGYPNDAAPNAAAGHYLGGSRVGTDESVTTYIYGGKIRGVRGAGFGAYFKSGAISPSGCSYCESAYTCIYGGEGFETGIMPGYANAFPADYADYQDVEPYELVIEPDGEIYIQGAVAIRKDAEIITLLPGKYLVNGETGDLGATSFNKVTITDGVEFEVLKWTQGKTYFIVSEDDFANATITTAEGVEELYYVDTTYDDDFVRVRGGYQPIDLFYGLQPDVSGSELQIKAYLIKSAVETLSARYGDNFKITYSFAGASNTATLADLTLEGDYYTFNLGYLKASDFYKAYSFSSTAVNTVKGDFLALLAQSYADEGELFSEAEENVFKALYAYGYQAGLKYVEGFNYTAAEGLGDATDEALLNKYTASASGPDFSKTSTEAYEVYGMSAVLGNQVSIRIYAVAPDFAEGDVVKVQIGTKVIEATLKAATVGETQMVYFTLNPALDSMADVLAMTILDAEGTQLATVNVSVPGYAAGMILDNTAAGATEDNGLYYAILAYADAVLALNA